MIKSGGSVRPAFWPRLRLLLTRPLWEAGVYALVIGVLRMSCCPAPAQTRDEAFAVVRDKLQACPTNSEYLTSDGLSNNRLHLDHGSRLENGILTIVTDAHLTVTPAEMPGSAKGPLGTIRGRTTVVMPLSRLINPVPRFDNVILLQCADGSACFDRDVELLAVTKVQPDALESDIVKSEDITVGKGVAERLALPVCDDEQAQQVKEAIEQLIALSGENKPPP